MVNYLPFCYFLHEIIPLYITPGPSVKEKCSYKYFNVRIKHMMLLKKTSFFLDSYEFHSDLGHLPVASSLMTRMTSGHFVLNYVQADLLHIKRKKILTKNFV